MTRGYLLDTNILSLWFDNHDEPGHSRVIDHVDALESSDLLRTSVIVLGEIEFGHRAASPRAGSPIQQTYKKFLKEHVPIAYDVGKATTLYYGPLRARLFEKFAPKRKKGKKLRPEQLKDPVTALELGIDENDLWLAAQALERNLVLVTHDKMKRIQEVLGGDFRLRIEDWAA